MPTPWSDFPCYPSNLQPCPNEHKDGLKSHILHLAKESNLVENLDFEANRLGLYKVAYLAPVNRSPISEESWRKEEQNRRVLRATGVGGHKSGAGRAKYANHGSLPASYPLFRLNIHRGMNHITLTLRNTLHYAAYITAF